VNRKGSNLEIIAARNSARRQLYCRSRTSLVWHSNCKNTPITP
jgi:hypothetical protein